MAKKDHLMDRLISIIQTLAQNPGISGNAEITPQLQTLQTTLDELQREIGSEDHNSTLFAPLSGTNPPAPTPIPVKDQYSPYVDKTNAGAIASNVNQSGAAGPALSGTETPKPTPTPSPYPTPSPSASVNYGGSTSY